MQPGRTPSLFILGSDMTRSEISALIDSDVEKHYALFESYLKDNMETIKTFPKLAFILNMKNSSWRVKLTLSQFPDMWRRANVYTKNRLPFQTVYGNIVYLDCTQPRVVSEKGINIKDLKTMGVAEKVVVAKEMDIEFIKKAFDMALAAPKIREGRTNESIIRQAYLNKIEMTYEDYRIIKGNDNKILSEEELEDYTPKVIQEYWLKRAKTSLRKK